MPNVDLYDIILPQDPGFNWFLLLEWTLGILGAVLVLGLLAWWMRRLWRPLRWRLEYRLIVARHARKTWPQLLMACQNWRQTTQVFWQTQTDYAQMDYQAFGALLDQACYGDQTVSRAVLLDLLDVAGQQLWDLARKDSRAYWQQQWHSLRTNWRTYHD